MRFESRLLFIPAVIAIVAYAGSSVTTTNLGWYATLTLPAWTPPGAVIGAVWTALYVLVAIAAFLFFTRVHDAAARRKVASWYFLNAALNVGWSVIFFGMHALGSAVLVALMLTASVWMLVGLKIPRAPLAAALLVPYGVWTLFASFLTIAIWRMNI